MINRKRYSFIEIEEKDEREKLIESTKLVFITVTDSEKAAFFEKFKPLPDRKAYIEIYSGRNKFYIGRFGSYQAGYVRCSMGTMEADSAGYVTKEALNLFKPDLVVMPGIAFGINEKKQKIGDVLVSEIVSPYEPERVGKDESTLRGVPFRAGGTLKSRFKEVMDWDFSLGNGKASEIHFGNLLSGNKLVDDLKYRTQLADKFEKPIGGEMEGTGVSAVCNEAGVEFIIAKGICDWADGEKHKEWQPKAAQASVSLCEHIFSKRTAFEDTNLNKLDKSEIENQIYLDEVRGERGTPLWAINSLRSDVLSQLIKDLEKYQDKGFDETCCQAVKRDLDSLKESSRKMAPEMFGGKSLYDELVRFYATYSEWNDINGNSDSSIEKRIKKVGKLKYIREKISERVRNNTAPISRTLSPELAEEMLAAQVELTDQFPEVFSNTREAVNRYERKKPNKGVN
jgi:nucleoside phosphorylase